MEETSLKVGAREERERAEVRGDKQREEEWKRRAGLQYCAVLSS